MVVNYSSIVSVIIHVQTKVVLAMLRVPFCKVMDQYDTCLLFNAALRNIHAMTSASTGFKV